MGSFFFLNNHQTSLSHVFENCIYQIWFKNYLKTPSLSVILIDEYGCKIIFKITFNEYDFQNI